VYRYIYALTRAALEKEKLLVLDCELDVL